MNNGGVISLFLDYKTKEQFASTGCCSMSAPYWSECPNSRSEAIAMLRDYLDLGFDAMDEETAYANDVTL